LLRRDPDTGRTIVVACNFTPVPLHDYRLGVPSGGAWREVLNSDAEDYAGSGQGNLGAVTATDEPCHGRPHSLRLTLPPLGVVFMANNHAKNDDGDA
jgi:1,4-alpha-glucan branching enzyme